MAGEPGFRYTALKGWTGGESDRLYAIVDKVTGRVLVRPAFDLRGIGPDVAIRHALRSEAEREWQSPLHPGWKVDPDIG